VLTVRAARPDDAYPIADVRIRAWRWAYAGIIPDETLDAMNVEASARGWREGLTRPEDGHEVRVALHEGEVRGFTAFGPYRVAPDRSAVDERYAEVYAIYVKPDHAGTGIGRALMDAAVARLAERGWREVRLWVLEANLRARRFYERFGFVLDATGDGRSWFVASSPGAAPVQVPEVRYGLAIGDRQANQ
jgi:ribosomal protein S18 acetylase RimI-like enzyme